MLFLKVPSDRIRACLQLAAVENAIRSIRFKGFFCGLFCFSVVFGFVFFSLLRGWSNTGRSCPETL